MGSETGGQQLSHLSIHGCPPQAHQASGSPVAAGGGPTESHGQRQHVPVGERARHVILWWRLRRCYVLYCLGCCAVASFLLIWNVLEGAWNWCFLLHHQHVWEEVLEAAIAFCFGLETLLTLYVVGPQVFFRKPWCILDAVVIVLMAVSFVYSSTCNLGVCVDCERLQGVDVAFLIIRLVLQPLRVLAICAGAFRARRLQQDVDASEVDFDLIAPRTSGLDAVLHGSRFRPAV
mmetsp:Transcript_12195/g.28639  ORF Transcript_12195/g.28639 Transcript_12195/m.28639 type:complete len:233 (-) Transcript_12195:224-922(-)